MRTKSKNKHIAIKQDEKLRRLKYAIKQSMHEKHKISTTESAKIK